MPDVESGAPATPQAPPPPAAPPPAPAAPSSITQHPPPPAPAPAPAAPSAPAEVVVKAPDKLPPGYAADKMIAALKGIKGMTSEAAQAFLELDIKAYESGTAERDKVVAGWADAVKVDPDIGGAKYEAAMQHAKRGEEFLGGQALRDLLGPLARHPVILKAFAKAGERIAEDSARSTRPANTPPTVQDALREAYPTMFNPDGTPK